MTDTSLPHPAPRILIVDDEPHVRRFLRLSLQAEGFAVLEASTAEEAISIVYSTPPELLILDLGLPDLDGRQVIRDVRLTSAMPILVISGRTEDSEKILALEQGADDYLTKPFIMRELVRRVHAALQQQPQQALTDEIFAIHTGHLHIDMQIADVKRGAESVDLDEEEYAVLRLLAQHRGRVLTAGSIGRALWGKEDESHRHRHLQKRIQTLRHKLEDEPSFPRYIVTEPAIGYKLEMLPPIGRA